VENVSDWKSCFTMPNVVPPSLLDERKYMAGNFKLGFGFTRFSFSNLLAQCAEQIGLATAPLLAVFLFKANPSETALLQAAHSLPFLLLAIPAGLLADRSSKRTMLVAAELVRAACFAIILLLVFTNWLSLPMLAALGFIGAAGTVAYNVTSPGVVPLLVDRALLSTANSRLELARSIAFTAGPSVAGLLYSAWGGSVAYVIALILSLSAVSLVAQVPLASAEARPRALLVELREGFGFAFSNQHLRPVLLTVVAFNMSWFILQAAFVPFAAQHLSMSAGKVGGTMAVYGVGMITGALLIPWLVNRFRFGTLILMGPIGGFLGAALMSATVWIHSELLVSAAFFCFGAGPVIWAATTATLRQAVTPQKLIGRVSSVYMTFTFGSRPVGAFIAAAVAWSFGSSACIIAALVGFSVQLAIISISEIRHLKTVPGLAT
jgi:MFS family permease